ncbi:HET domain-containing protein [Colletotrichum abscissum]|uniref:HET domain-containing protein n=1 Tax=Colletotrichum abscissum TaxID=1671311 RepID=A0A9P9XDL7_9PEZI|nr:HET domain-containing protein [Colletotrichum abscissum]KAI3547734.1 HET domain-containing protein [Colletotrichum abscissum]KAK1508857.1 HET domain-containing protein [Colletotrichum abscissum]
MRLLETETLTLHEFVEGHVPEYAILSHTWGEEEVLFRDLENGPSDKAGWIKIQSACRVAYKRGYDWIWIDTCCIDKASSSELSEAINSMFRWYKEAAICLAYLSDIVYCEPGTDECETTLAGSRWFTRGWTLQELLAPSSLDFYDRDWTLVGSRALFRGAIEKNTGIESIYLSGERGLASASVAERMSWASERTTTRTEDVAYCLLGIFDVNMPLIYGEGIKAFQRLQEAIIRDNDDQSIFAWGNPHEGNVVRIPSPLDGWSLLASSPKDFTHSGDVIPIFHITTSARVRIENSGITFMTPLLAETPSKWVNGPSSTAFLAPLLCRRRTDIFNTIALSLHSTKRPLPNLDRPDGMSYYRVSNQLFKFPMTAWVNERLCSAFIYLKASRRFRDIGDERGYAPNWGCAIRTLPQGFTLGTPYSSTWGQHTDGMQPDVLPITERLVESYGLASPIVIPLHHYGYEATLALVLQYQYMSTATGYGGSVIFDKAPSWMVNRVVSIPLGSTIEEVAETVRLESESWPAEYVRQISGANRRVKPSSSKDLFDRSSLGTYTRFHVGVSTERVHGNLQIIDVEDSRGSNVSLEVDHNGIYTPVKGTT